MSQAASLATVSAPQPDLGRRPEDLILLTAPSMRARRNPGAIAALWLWQTALALLASLPAAGLAGAAYGRDLQGDAPLWAPGAHALLDWLWHDAHGVRAILGGAEVILVAGSLLGLVPTAALMIEIAYVTRSRPHPGLARSLAGGVRALPSMLLLGVLSGLAQAVIAGVGVGLAKLLELWAHGPMGEARAEQIEGTLGLLALGLASGVGVAHDLGRAAIVLFEARGLRAFALGMRTLRGEPSLWWSWAWRASSGLVLVLIGGVVASRLGGRGGLSLLVLALLHQVVVVSRIALRASWLARALRAVDGLC